VAIELACIMVPAPAVEGVLKDCVAKGVKAVIVMSAGFQEIGSRGTRHMEVRDQTAYVFAPSDGLFEPLHLAGDQVRSGELAGYLHFIEEWARPPLPIEYRSDGTIWMAPGSGRVRKGDVLNVIMRPHSRG